MKCTVKQYCAYLCRVINHENTIVARALTDQLAHATSTGLPKGAFYGQGKKRTATRPAHRPT